MDYSIVFKELEGLQNLIANSLNFFIGNSCVDFEVLIQVAPKQFESNANMTSEHKILLHLYHITLRLIILSLQKLQYPNLHLPLIMETLPILNNLQRQKHIISHIQHFNHLPKAPMSKHFKDFIAISYMIPNTNSVILLIIIKTSAILQALLLSTP